MSTIPQHVRDLFEALDKDDSGALDKDELEVFLINLGLTDSAMRLEKLNVLMQAVGKDRSGVISLDEFWSCVNTIGLQQQQDQQDQQAANKSTLASRGSAMRRGLAAFREIDSDGNGELDRNELKLVLQRIGVAEADLGPTTDILMTKLDADNNGSVSLDEFIEAVKNGQIDALVEGTSELQHETDVVNDGDDDDILMFDANNTKRPPSSKVSLPNRTNATSAIPDNKFQYLWDLFCVADDDQSGCISEEELYDLMNDPTLFTESSSKELIHSIMKAIDKDGNGSLDFEEFCDAFDQMFYESHRQNKGILDAKTDALARENMLLKEQLAAKTKELELAKVTRTNEATKEELEDEIDILHKDFAEQQQQTQMLTNTRERLEEELMVQNKENKRLKALLEDRNESLSQTKVSNFDEENIIQGLKDELVDQSKMYEEELDQFLLQAAIAEVQLENAGYALVMQEQIAQRDSRPFMHRLDEKKRQEVHDIADKASRYSRKNMEELVSLSSLEEAVEMVHRLQADKAQLQEALRELLAKEQAKREELELQHMESEKQWQESFKELQDGTRKIFQEKAEEHQEEVDLLKAQLSRANEELQNTRHSSRSSEGDVSKRLQGARLRLKSTDELSDKVLQLQDELKKEKGEKEQLADKCLELEEMVEQLKYQVQNMQGENTDMQEELEVLNSQLNLSQSQIDSLSKETEELRRNSNSAGNNGNNNNNNNNANSVGSAVVISGDSDKLKEEINELKEQNEDLRRAAIKDKEENEKQKKEIAIDVERIIMSLRDELASKTASVNELKQALDDKENALRMQKEKSTAEVESMTRKLMDKVNKQQESIATANSRYEQEAEAHKQLQLSLDEKLEALQAKHDQEMMEEKAAHQKLQTKIDDLHSELMNLRSRELDEATNATIQQQETEIDALNTKLSTLYVEMTALVEEKNNISKERDNLMKKLYDAIEAKKEAEARIEQQNASASGKGAQQAMQTLVSKLQMKRLEIHTLTEDLRLAREDVASHEAMLLALRTKEKDLLDTVEHLCKNLGSHGDPEVELVEQLSLLKLENASLKEDMQELRKGEQLMDEMNANNQQLVFSLTEQIQRMKDRCRCDVLEGEILSLEGQLTRMTEALAKESQRSNELSLTVAKLESSGDAAHLKKKKIIGRSGFDVDISEIMRMVNYRVDEIEMLASGKSVDRFSGGVNMFHVSSIVSDESLTSTSGMTKENITIDTGDDDEEEILYIDDYVKKSPQKKFEEWSRTRAEIIEMGRNWRTSDKVKNFYTSMRKSNRKSTKS